MYIYRVQVNVGVARLTTCKFFLFRCQARVLSSVSAFSADTRFAFSDFDSLIASYPSSPSPSPLPLPIGKTVS